MARVVVDYIPLIKETEQNVKTAVNVSLQKANEILRLLATGVNMVEIGDGSSVTENMWCSYVNVQFGTAGTELSGAHTLGKIPTTIIGKKLDSPGDIYFSKAATSTTIYLKCDTDSTSGVLVIA